jgi:predicted nucleotidyltransferase
MHEAERELQELIKRQDVDQLCQRYAQLLSDFDVEFLVLYGSRARGDHSVYSDIDIAVVLSTLPNDHNARTDVLLGLGDLAWDIELETGLVISPMPISMAEYNDPELFSNPRLIENMKREGRVFWRKK